MGFRDRKKAGDLKGYLIIFVACLILIGSFSYFFINESNKIKVDKNTYCPVNKKEQFGKTVALLDLTDPLNKTQKEFFLKEIEQLKSQIPKYHSLTIYTLDQDLDLSKSRKISMCNPGTIEDISSTFEKISSNPKDIKNNWEKGFSEKISNVINNIIVKNNSQNTSPVMEMFQLISINEFKGFEGTNNEIIILSDMIQNTPEMSMYSNANLSFAEFSKSPYFSKVNTNLNNNVYVKLFVLKRDGSRKIQESKSFRDFWVQYFYNGNKASNFKIVFVDG